MKIIPPVYNWQSYSFGSISLCMIMKNATKHLQRCLNSVRGLVNEIIIVDTGSTDNSVELARSLGCKVFFDLWQDDFSRPRNISISKATCDWVLIMDPDEIILRKDHTPLKWLTRSKNILAWRLTTFNYSRDPRELGYRTLIAGTDPTGQYTGFVPSTKTRLFKNGLGMTFRGCWHELLDWYIIRHDIPVATAKIPIHHWGHEIIQSSYQDKTMFYLKLGEKKVKDWPTNGQAWWELAVAEAIAGYRHRAAHHIAKALSLGFGGANTMFTLSRILKMIGQKKRGRLSFEKGICMLFPTLTHIDPGQKPIAAVYQ